MSSVMIYDRLLEQLCSTHPRIWEPSPEEFAQIRDPEVFAYDPLAKPVGNGMFSVQFQPRPPASPSDHAQSSPNNSNSNLSADAEPFIPTPESQAMVESLSPTEENPFLHLTPPGYGPTRNAPTNAWVEVYIDPYHFRLGAGQLTTVPALTTVLIPEIDHTRKGLAIEQKLTINEYAIKADVERILRKHHIDCPSKAVKLCARQSFHLGENRPIPTVFIRYHEERTKWDDILAALLEIKKMMWKTRKMPEVAVEIVDDVFDHWLEGAKRNAIKLDERLWITDNHSLVVGRDQEDVLELFYPEGAESRRAVFEMIGGRPPLGCR
ncbi:uncharacterized protein DSM5745_10406 [Aspergillus mulundensis]|uniref:Uncharacterized protein n=1 Tax=Aspergillus mulundensis TaxID=1810919 RepID=A0A3D8QJX6_9EURO|nr:hypothetical protein DSM5745_10406 [Aspergillus mulundensis]RDW61734.1 hypothetical protein DSM5745_10406 [Aspergillus mulundensis]